MPKLSQHSLLHLFGVLMVCIVALSGCAGDNAGGGGFNDPRAAAGKIQVCRSGDQLVSSSRQCLQDGAACYQISNGSWCTGERGNVCPAGSTKLPEGAACPLGARCIPFGESLNCAITIQ